MKLTKPGELRSFAAYPQCSADELGGTASVTTHSPDDQAVPTPPEDTTQAYAQRVWRDVRVLLIASGVAGVAVIAMVLMIGYRLAGGVGLTIATVMAVAGIVLVARKLLTY